VWVKVSMGLRRKGSLQQTTEMVLVLVQGRRKVGGALQKGQ
jgi:hypothetical protein